MTSDNQERASNLIEHFDKKTVHGATEGDREQAQMNSFFCRYVMDLDERVIAMDERLIDLPKAIREEFKNPAANFPASTGGHVARWIVWYKNLSGLDKSLASAALMMFLSFFGLTPAKLWQKTEISSEQRQEIVREFKEATEEVVTEVVTNATADVVDAVTQ